MRRVLFLYSCQIICNGKYIRSFNLKAHSQATEVSFLLFNIYKKGEPNTLLNSLYYVYIFMLSAGFDLSDNFCQITKGYTYESYSSLALIT